MSYRAMPLVATLGILLSACGGDLPVEIPGLSGDRMTDEEQIIAVLDDFKRGLETRKIYKVLAHISRNYTDNDGRDYNGVQVLLGDFLKNYRRIKVTRVRPRITVQDTRARSVETFGLRAQPLNPDANSFVDINGQVNVYLEKVDGAWKIAEWTPVQ